MPIVVGHTPVAALATVAQQVGNFNTARANSADAFRNDSFALTMANNNNQAAADRAFRQSLADQQFQQQQQLQQQNANDSLMREALAQQSQLQNLALSNAFQDNRLQDQQDFTQQLDSQHAQNAQDLARVRGQLSGQNALDLQGAKDQSKLMDQQQRDQVATYIDQNTGTLFTPEEAAKAKVNLAAGSKAPVQGQMMADFVRQLAAKTQAASDLQVQKDQAAGDRQGTALDAADRRQTRQLDAADQRQQRSLDASAGRAEASGDRADTRALERRAHQTYGATDANYGDQIRLLTGRIRQVQNDTTITDPEVIQQQINAINDQIRQLSTQRDANAHAYTTLSPDQYLSMVRGGPAPTTRPAPVAATAQPSPATQPAAATELPTQSGRQDPAQAARNAGRQAPPPAVTDSAGATWYFTGQYDATGRPLYSTE